MTNFSLTEYQEYGKIGDSSIPLVPYCFLRRNLAQDASVKKVLQYINAVLCHWDEYSVVMNSRAYEIFREEFLENKYLIIP